MSILVEIAPAPTPTPVTTAPVPQEDPAQALPLAGFLLALAIGGMVLMRVFRRGSIVGPNRLGAKVGVGKLVGVALLSGMLWITAQGFFAAMAGPEIRAKDLALLSTVPSVIALIAMVIGDRALHPRLVRRLGLTLWNFARAWKVALLAALVVLPTVYGFSIMLEVFYRSIHYEHPGEHEMLGAMAKASVLVRALLVVGACVIAPVYEEMLFRGHIQTIAVRMLRGPRIRGDSGATARWVAVIGASLVFALVHPIWMAPMIFVLALGLGYAYERTGNLWVSILIHAMFNTISTVVFLNLR
jgi:membrane protease YdiL (CAAX protease family)